MATKLLLDSIRVREFDSRWFGEVTDKDAGGGISFRQNKVWCSCDWISPAIQLTRAMNSRNITCRTRGSPGWKGQIDIEDFGCDHFEASGESPTNEDLESYVTTTLASQATVSTTRETTISSMTPFQMTTLNSELEFDVEIDQSSLDSDNILEPKETPVVIFNSQDVTSDILMSSRSIFDDDFEESGDFWIDSTDEGIFEDQTENLDLAEDLTDGLVESEIEEDFEYDEQKSEMSDLEFESLIEMLELHFNNIEPTTNPIRISADEDNSTRNTPMYENYSDPSFTTTTLTRSIATTTATTTETTTATTSAATTTTTDATTNHPATTPKLETKISPKRVTLFSFVQHHSRDGTNEDEVDQTRISSTTSAPMKTTLSPKQKRLLRQEKVREKAAQRRERDRQRALEAKKKREARILRDKVKKVNAAIEKAERTWAAKQIATIKKDVKIQKENQANAFSDFKVGIISYFTVYMI